MRIYKIHVLLIILLVIKAIQASAQTNEFDGTWKHTVLKCRGSSEIMAREYKTKLVTAGDQYFYPDVEFKLSTEDKKDGTVPQKYAEKTVLQSSCKLTPPDMQPMNANSTAYIWSKDQVQIQPLQEKEGIAYYRMTGKLVDNQVNYSAIKSCGANAGSSVSVFGLLGVVGTFFKYDFVLFGKDKSYFQKEAGREYIMYLYNGRLYLEFKDSELCKTNEKVIMEFEKK